MTYPSYSFYVPRCSMNSSQIKDGLCGLFNRSDPYSGGYIDIREISTVQLSPTGDSTGLANNTTGVLCDELEVSRITVAPSLGSGEVISPAAFDSAAPALPAQVTCYAMPDESPSSVNTSFRRTSFYPYSSAIFVLTNMQSSLGTSGVYRVKPGTQTEPIVLREGQGIAVLCSAYIMQRKIPIEIVVNVRATGRTYIFRTEDAAFSTGRLSQPAMSLFNGAGSGAILDVFVVNSAYAGDVAQVNANFAAAYQRLGIIDEYSGAKRIESPSPLDSANSIPSGIECVTGPFQSRVAGERSRSVKAWTHTYPGMQDFTNTGQPVAVTGNEQAIGRARSRLLNPMLATNIGFAVTPPPTVRAWWRSQGGQPGLLIKPGEGIAILGGADGAVDTSPFNVGGFQFIFNYIPIQNMGPSYSYPFVVPG